MNKDVKEIIKKQDQETRSTLKERRRKAYAQWKAAYLQSPQYIRERRFGLAYGLTVGIPMLIAILALTIAMMCSL